MGASFADFASVATLDSLIGVLTNTMVCAQWLPGVPVWLDETSSATLGGLPGASDRFVAGFTWLDKLGLAAAMRVSLVARHALYGNSAYSLLNNDGTPRPGARCTK